MRESLRCRFISSLEKCFYDETITSKPELKQISMLKNEHLSVQLAMQETDTGHESRNLAKVVVKGPLSPFVTIRNVEHVNVSMPLGIFKGDDNYLREQKPGLYPDLLTPLRNAGCALLLKNALHALWIDIRPNAQIDAGIYPLTIELFSEDESELYAAANLDIEIIGADLPEKTLHYSEWFHGDCLARYYDVDVYSEKHWEIIENFIKTATDGGIDMILTPILTPPLDTKVGGERPTCQLVDITLNDGKYAFGFDKLNRWIDLLLKYHVRLIEMSHLFTQWGAAHAPKVMATVDGVYKKIFGWETEATDAAYVQFLHEFLTALLAFLKQKGVDQMCWWHISDEPNLSQLDNYLSAKKIVTDLLKGYTIMDAISDYDFYETGAITQPVTCTNSIDPFLEAKVPNLFAYYCCSGSYEVSNRFVAMPSARNRIMGLQLYCYNIAGFMQWGYNFYFNRYSVDLINPYQDLSGDYFVPAGDAFSVYPGTGGKALDSIRFLVFKHGLEDWRAFKLCEQLYGREYVINLIEGDLDEKITFRRYPKEAAYLLNLREKVNAAIKAKL